MNAQSRGKVAHMIGADDSAQWSSRQGPGACVGTLENLDGVNRFHLDLHADLLHLTVEEPSRGAGDFDLGVEEFVEGGAVAPNRMYVDIAAVHEQLQAVIGGIPARHDICRSDDAAHAHKPAIDPGGDQIVEGGSDWRRQGAVAENGNTIAHNVGKKAGLRVSAHQDAIARSQVDVGRRLDKDSPIAVLYIDVFSGAEIIGDCSLEGDARVVVCFSIAESSHGLQRGQRSLCGCCPNRNTGNTDCG